MTVGKGSILYIGGFELPDKNAAAQRVLSNGKLLRDLGYNVVFAGIYKGVDPRQEKTINEEHMGFDTYSIRYPSNKISWLKYLTESEPYVEIANKIDDLQLIICYNFQSISLHKIINYCRKRNISCVGDVTEWYSGEGRPFIERILKDLDTYYRMKILHNKMDGLIVISKYLQEYYAHNKNVLYLPPLTTIKPCDERNKSNTMDEPLKLIYAGSPGHKDRLDYLISAVTHTDRKIALKIIGITEKEYKALYPNQTADLDSERLVFLGRIPHKMVVELLQEADYSVFFRDITRITQAGFPTKFAEAISAGVPVITNASSNIKDYIGDNKNGIIVDNLSVTEIQHILEKAPLHMYVDSKTFYYESYYGDVQMWMNNML